MENFKPLLAFTVEDTSTLKYPLYASVKLDGIRAVVLDGVVYSRSMKPIRSKAVQSLFGRQVFNGLDGELLYGPWNADDVFNKTTQACMSFNLKKGFEPENLSFAVFDYVLTDKPYNERLKHVSEIVRAAGGNVRLVEHVLVKDQEDLLRFEAGALEMGFEGVMVRSVDGEYKQGRSTLKEGIVGKLKRFSDAEAVVVGFEEKMTNTNEKRTNELGYTERSSSKEGLVGANTLGALVCECNGVRFTMGSGFDDATRKEVWNNKEKYIGKLAKFKYFAVGMKDSFRFPIFLGWRDEDDL